MLCHQARSLVTHHLFLCQEIKAVGLELGITPVIIRGEELKQRGFGGTGSVDTRHQCCQDQPQSHRITTFD